MNTYDLLTACLNMMGIWIVWRFGWKRLVIDEFRQSLFNLRDRLFYEASQGENGLAFNHPAYCGARNYLNTLIENTHRINTPTVLLMFCVPGLSRKMRSIKTPLDTAIEKADSKLIRDRLKQVRDESALRFGTMLFKTSFLFVAMCVVTVISLIVYALFRHSWNRIWKASEELIIERMDAPLRSMETA